MFTNNIKAINEIYNQISKVKIKTRKGQFKAIANYSLFRSTNCELIDYNNTYKI